MENAKFQYSKEGALFMEYKNQSVKIPGADYYKITDLMQVILHYQRLINAKRYRLERALNRAKLLKSGA